MQWTRILCLSLCCTISVTSANQKVTHRLTGDGLEYLVVKEHSTWKESRYICHSNLATLAEIHSEADAEILLDLLLDSHIPLKNAWIGGYFNRSHWLWSGSGEVIPLRNDSFPHWLRWSPWDGPSRCIGAVVARGKKLLMWSQRCDKSRPCICVRDTRGKNTNILPQVVDKIQKHDRVFVIHQAEYTHKEAEHHCESIGMDLSYIKNHFHLTSLGQAMIQIEPPMESMWVSGIAVMERKAHIDQETQMFPDKTCTAVLAPVDVDSEVTWMDINCNQTFGFVCSKPAEKELNVFARVCSDKVLILYSDEDTDWSTAQLKCRERGGSLVEPSTQECFDVAVRLMGEPDKEKVEAWSGGTVDHGQWRWSSSNTSIPYIGTAEWTNFPPWCDLEINSKKKCMTIGQYEVDRPQVYGSVCGKEQALICQFPHYQPINVTDECGSRLPTLRNGQWYCENSSFIICHGFCNEGYMLEGGTSISCIDNKWTHLNDHASVIIPINCIYIEDKGKWFHELLLTARSLLFVVDVSLSITDMQYVKMMKLVQSIVSTTGLSEDLPAGLIFFSSVAEVKLQFNVTDACDFINALPNLYREKKPSSTHYDEAFSAALNQIKTHNRTEAMIIFITDGISNGGGNYMDYVADIESGGNKIWFIVTRDISEIEEMYIPDFTNLNSVASLVQFNNTHRLLSTMQSFYDLEALALAIGESSSRFPVQCSETLDIYELYDDDYKHRW